MQELSKEDFHKFLLSFHNNPRYFNTLEEISRSDKGNPLTNVPCSMYNLDHMKDDVKSLNDLKPKSMDAIFYKEEENILYLFEFKGADISQNSTMKLDILVKELVMKNNANVSKKSTKCISTPIIKNLMKFREDFIDPIESSLKLKPIESLTMTIPSIYNEYCQEKGCTPKDIRSFLNNCQKNIFVLVKEDVREDEDLDEILDEKKKGKFNRSFYERLTKSKNINDYYYKLKRDGIIDDYQIGLEHKFRNYLKSEDLLNNTN